MYGGYQAQILNGSVSIDGQEYYSDEPADQGNGATTYTPSTPHTPRDSEGAFRVIVEDEEELDLTTYFSESESEDDASGPIKEVQKH